MLINCDLGEGLDNDAAIMPYLDMANIACTGHAGDAESMRRTAALALEHGVEIGAHVSFEDRAHFGRRHQDLDPAVLTDACRRQIDALAEVCAALDAEITYVKPHGALYHAMMHDPAVCAAIVAAMRDAPVAAELVVMAGPAADALERAALEQQVALRFEAFVDRVYDRDGRLLSRDLAHACHAELAAIGAQAQALIESAYVLSHEAEKIPVQADTLCIHGDHALAVETARLLRDLLRDLQQ